jgi:hypothetical protein
MTGPVLLPFGPEEIELALIGWFAPIRRSSTVWETGDGTPFTLITHLTGGEDIEVGFGDPIVQIDTLCAKSLGYLNARNEKKITHQRMLELGRNLDPIPLNGWVFGADYVKVIEGQQRLPFGMTTVIRYVGRYQIGIQYSPVSVTTSGYPE